MKHALIIVAGLGLAVQAAQAGAQAKTIELTQTPCQFLESEGGKDRGFKSAKAADCESINKRTRKQRLSESTTCAANHSWTARVCPAYPAAASRPAGRRTTRLN